jgi:hypothetical protein
MKKPIAPAVAVSSRTGHGFRPDPARSPYARRDPMPASASQPASAWRFMCCRVAVRYAAALAAACRAWRRRRMGRRRKSVLAALARVESPVATSRGSPPNASRSVAGSRSELRLIQQPRRMLRASSIGANGSSAPAATTCAMIVSRRSCVACAFRLRANARSPTSNCMSVASTRGDHCASSLDGVSRCSLL